MHKGRPCRIACVVSALIQHSHQRSSSVMSKLTKQFIESEIQPPVTGQCFYRDEDVPGFAIRVTPKSKSYIFEKRVDGANRRITIGKCNEMSVDSARKQACIMLGDIAKGNDPKPANASILSTILLCEKCFKSFSRLNRFEKTRREITTLRSIDTLTIGSTCRSLRSRKTW